MAGTSENTPRLSIWSISTARSRLGSLLTTVFSENDSSNVVSQRSSQESATHRRLLGPRLRSRIDSTDVKQSSCDEVSVEGSSSSVVGQSVIKIYSFEEEDSSLLRGSDLATIMQGAAAILEDSSGSEETYKLSEKVSQIDYFISHNWIVPRWGKYACLALFFDFDMAVVVTLCLVLVVMGLMGLNYAANVTTLLSFPAFLIAIRYGRSLYDCVGWKGPTVFLDKTCIDQGNQARQKAGINKLGAFLYNTSSMLVIFSDVYLQRLWTVYEVASFISLTTEDNMKVVPLFVPRVLAVVMVLIYAANLLLYFRVFAADVLLVLFLLCTALLLFFRRFARIVANIHTSLEEFDVRLCNCANEDDRPKVYDNIAVLMRNTRDVEHTASRDEALDAFTTRVRKTLPRAIARAIGNHLGLTYKHLFWLSMATTFPIVWLHDLRVKSDVSMPVFLVLCIVMIMGLQPVGIALLADICRCALHLHGLREVFFLACGLLLLFGCLGANKFVIEFLANEKSATGLVALLAYGIVCSCTAVLVLWPKGWERQRHCCRLLFTGPNSVAATSPEQSSGSRRRSSIRDSRSLPQGGRRVTFSEAA